MVRHLNRALAVALVVGAGLYVTLINNEHIALRLPPALGLDAEAGVIYLAIFFVGFLVAGVIGVFVGLRSYWHERRLRNLEKQRQYFAARLLEARSELAVGDWESAKSLWKEIIRKDPDNVVARVELSKALAGEGDVVEALRVLDATRASLRSNVEVLLGAIDLNIADQNLTAALDNAVLLLEQHPSKKAALIATELAEKLERYDDALEYLEQLEKLGEQRDDIRDRLLYKRLLKEHAHEPNALREALTFFVKKHPSSNQALEKLAELESKNGNITTAADLLIKRAKLTKSSKDWNAVSKLWLASSSLDVSQRAEKSIAASRSAVNDTHGQERLNAQLSLIHLLISVNRLDEAKKNLDGFAEFTKKEGLKVEGVTLQHYLFLKGLCLHRSGLSREACSVWETLADSNDSAMQTPFNTSQNLTEPSPIYSTP